MHPILARSGRLGLYLLGWIPLTGLLVLLLAGSGKWGWGETLALVAPLCLLYAFVCLSAWYPVRATPVQRFGLVRLATTHLSAALLVSALWVVTGLGESASLLPFLRISTGASQIKSRCYSAPVYCSICCRWLCTTRCWRSRF